MPRLNICLINVMPLRMRKDDISCLADAEAYLEEFEAVRKLSTGEVNPYRYVLQWYEKRFPNHSAVPEFDDQLKLINTPDHYAA